MFENIQAIQKTNQNTAVILNKLNDSGVFKDENDAFVVLRATLKAVRDRIIPGEAMQLASQLPALLRGFYLEGYDFSKMDRPRTESDDMSGFLMEVQNHLKGYEFLDLNKAVPVALKAVLESLDEGQGQQVLQQLPKEIQDMPMPMSMSR